MTKTGIFAVFMGVIYTLIIGFICYQIGTMHPRQEFLAETGIVQAETNSYAPRDTEAPTSAPENIVYTIREYNSHIGVYENDELVRIVNVDITNLRAQDVKRLKDGIKVGTKEEVAEILEDYSS